VAGCVAGWAVVSSDFIVSSLEAAVAVVRLSVVVTILLT